MAIGSQAAQESNNYCKMCRRNSNLAYYSPIITQLSTFCLYYEVGIPDVPKHFTIKSFIINKFSQATLKLNFTTSRTKI